MGTDVLELVVIAVISISIAGIFILRGPVGRALGRRIEGIAPESELAQRVEELETRLLVAEQVEGRLAEVEERLDFAERLLAKESKVPQIQGETRG